MHDKEMVSSDMTYTVWQHRLSKSEEGSPWATSGRLSHDHQYHL